ncbi:Flp pilus assembly complex ATPase component TadA, partial [Candidatus Dependentiae bacterium]|nr:Flp pilus assembly complex ATPase component TadA [Candidatus Dependentiae bacterium]
MKITKKRLGDMLIESNLLTEEQLRKALLAQKLTNERLGNVLKQLGFITEETLINFLSKQLSIPIVNLNKISLQKKLANLISRKYSDENKLLPINLENGMLTVVMADPLNVFVVDQLQGMTKCEIEVGIAPETQIMSSINKLYDSEDSSKNLLEDLDFTTLLENGNTNVVSSDDSPIVKLVTNMITEAFRKGASDVHFDPQKNGLAVRIRLDGIMMDLSFLQNNLKPLISSRLKIMGNLDIAEKRIPQDGRISINLDGKEIDLRISSLPTIYGEKIVLRILDKSSLFGGISELGFSELNLSRYKEIINRPQGIILVVGPTGSGKTTTLYASLQELNNGLKNIITIEDPVEYELRNTNQVPVNNKAGLTFANGLRSILRQDPDIIMLGEIRDQETARMAIQASLTGHLVFSTLHTLNAASSFNRLINMEIEPYLIATSVECVIAQRLVRKICVNCKRPVEITPETIR